MFLHFIVFILLLSCSKAINCINYGSYPITDGKPTALNMTQEIVYVDLGSNYSQYTFDGPGQLLNKHLNCNNTDGCNIICNAAASCYESTIQCASPTGCNIICVSGASNCHSMTIYARTYSNTSITIVCYQESCHDMKINIVGITSAHLHCVDEKSCKNVNVTFQDMSIPSVYSSVSCYYAYSCKDLIIYTDGPYTQLKMYQYSDNVELHNNIGYFISHGTVQCSLQDKYIKYYLDGRESIEALIKDQYLNLIPLPCSNVTIFCATNTTLNASCSMEYLYDLNTIHNKLNTDPKFVGRDCAYISLEDIIELECSGQCVYAPTTTPTQIPTDVPTETTGFPSRTPTATPSAQTDAPSVPPTTSPSNTPSAAPSVSPTTPSYSPVESTGMPSLSPTFRTYTLSPSSSPTDSPSFSPTQAPTRFPMRINNFDTKLDIIYGFLDLTEKNYNFIWNYSQNHAIEYIEDKLESAYFHSELMQSYSLFDIQIEKLNQIDIEKNKMDQTVIVTTGNQDIYAKSVILFESTYANYFISASQDFNWAKYVESIFQRYFNNTKLTFIVANSSTLRVEAIDIKEKKIRKSTPIIFWIITGILLSCVMCSICLSRCSKMLKMDTCLPVDNVNFLSLLLLGLAIYDVVTNINLVIEIFYVDSITNDIMICGIVMLLFVILRMILNAVYAINIGELISYNIYAKNWYKKNKNTFICFVVLCGGNCYPMLMLINSGIFGIEFTNSGMSLLELKTLYFGNNRILLSGLLFESVPLLILQFVYANISLNLYSQNLILALSSTLIFALIYIVFYMINCLKKKEFQDKMNIFYYIEMRLKQQFRDKKISKKEKKHIKNRKGLKLELKKQFIETNINVNKNLEIGNVTIRKKGFFTRFIHELSKLDLLQNKNDGDDMDDMDDDNINDNLESELKNYCSNLFNTNKQQIIEIMFNHYHELDSTKFEIRYHREYPVDDERPFIDDDNDEHEVDTVYNLSGIEGEHDMNEGEEGQRDEGNAAPAVMYDDESIDEEEKELNDHRVQFKKAISIINKEQKKKNGKVTDYNTILFILQANDINYTVIEDVLSFSKQSGMFGQKDESDIDQSYDSNHGEININKEVEMISMNNDSSSSTQFDVGLAASFDVDQ